MIMVGVQWLINGKWQQGSMYSLGTLGAFTEDRISDTVRVKALVFGCGYTIGDPETFVPTKIRVLGGN